jgi:hypothetical protein
MNSLYGQEKDRVIFDHAETMIAAIDKYRREKSRKDGFADLTSLTASRDPFRDGAARERIGLYMKTLFSGLDSGLTREAAVASANECYAKAFGQDKVSAVAAFPG